jgi:hypothetical protein
MSETFGGALWRKSASSSQSSACVEFAVVAGTAAVRDSKRPEAGHVAVSRTRWGSFLAAVKAGGFDL